VEQELLSLTELQSSLPSLVWYLLLKVTLQVPLVEQELRSLRAPGTCHVTSVGDISLNHKAKDCETGTTLKMAGNSGAL
jgi:hypothetical protein